MRKRSRVIRIFKWAGLSVCLTLLLASTVSFFKGVGYYHKTGQVLVRDGGLLVWNHPFRNLSGLRAFTAATGWSGRPLWHRVRGFFWVPKVDAGGVWVGFGLPLIFASAVTAYLFWRDSRRIPPGHCRKCGYDLTGNESGICPECGEPVECPA